MADEHIHSQDNQESAYSSGQVENKTAGQRPEECDGLEPLVAGGYAIGCHPDITGPDAVLVEFRPTRAELRTLAYHYLDRYFLEKLCAALGWGGSWEWREIKFTWRRFCAIEEALSPEEPLEEFRVYIDARWAEIDKECREAKSQRSATEKHAAVTEEDAPSPSGNTSDERDAEEFVGERIQIDRPSDGEGGVALVSLSPEREETKMQIEKGM